jgi:hypothetical protein
VREIIFRGKAVTGEWVFGSLDLSDELGPIIRLSPEDSRLHPFGAKLVIPNTIGQYTCFKDSEGSRIFEKDLVQFYYKGDKKVCEIIFDDKEGMFCLKWPDGYINHWKLNPDSYKVIGNIIDNPELLKGKKK